MTEHLTIDDGTIAFDKAGEGPLVVLAHGMGDSRHSYRFLATDVSASFTWMTGLLDQGLRTRSRDGAEG